jgi:hypothetical protein
MASCIKTGADVYLAEYGKVVHGDLFIVGDAYLLHCNYPWKEECGFCDTPHKDVHAVFHAIALSIDGVIIADAGDVGTTQLLRDYIGDKY